MTETNIPSTELKIRFAEDKVLEWDLTEAQFEIQAAAANAVQDFPDDDIDQNRAYYEGVRALASARGGFDITLSQAEQLIVVVEEAYAEHKKKLNGGRKSPSTTKSTPPDLIDQPSTPFGDTSQDS